MLAGVYVPLAFVSSCFGMNTAEISGPDGGLLHNPTVWEISISLVVCILVFPPGLATIPKASIRYRYWIILIRYYKDRYVSIGNRFLHRFLSRIFLFLFPLTFPSSYDDFIQIIYSKYLLYLNQIRFL
jgi:hypothetical protein